MDVHGFINPFFSSSTSVSSIDTESENEEVFLLEYKRIHHKKKYLFFLSFLFCIPIGIYTYYLRKKASMFYRQHSNETADKLMEKAEHFMIYGLVIGLAINALILYIYFEVIK
tara:strand:+ start:276 stop:614 length:339 start_codon:yes stop_codon:yes gene_type:complete